MFFKLLVVTAIIVTHQGYLPLVTAEQCTDRFMDLSLVKFRGSRLGLIKEGTRMDNEIRIVNSIQFTCPTQIDSIILGIDVREPTKNRNMYPSLQLWRPVDSNGRDGRDSGYELVPNWERPIVYTPADVSSSGIHEYPLIPPLNANPGDYLAISQPDTAVSVVRVYTVDGGLGSSYQIGLGVQLAGLTEAMNELILVYPITSDSVCVNSVLNSTLVMDQTLLGTSEARIINYRRQFLYPTIKFMCNGTINKWIYSGVTSVSGTKLPELQIWRQTSDGNYNKKGSSKASANQVCLLSPNVYKLIVDPPIEFMEGDIFGQFQPKEIDSAFIMYEQRFSGPTNLRSIRTFDEALDTINTDELEVAFNDYPLVTLEISMIASEGIMSLSSSPQQSITTILSPITLVQGSSTTGSIIHNTVLSYSSVYNGVVSSVHTADSSANQASALVTETSIHSTSDTSHFERVSVSIVVGPVVAGVVVVIAIIIAVVVTIGVWRIVLKHRNDRDRATQAQQTTNDYELDPCYMDQHHYMVSSGVRADDNIYKEI